MNLKKEAFELIKREDPDSQAGDLGEMADGYEMLACECQDSGDTLGAENAIIIAALLRKIDAMPEAKASV